MFTLAGFIDGRHDIPCARGVVARTNEQWAAALAQAETAPSAR